ncbi:hypothetical protein GTU79_25455 [Sodalis ligni]|uniref:hypothetical protein n=1 Tax=Sodalis ligni TaxID=2697027 RepID=UPI00193F766B|nr:hypothetical protein [Sodalis ligni]QWA10510.1 hypothetical protein GTU79_25455 [Sodalis ligni]
MTLFHKIKTLIGRCDVSRQRCELQLASDERRRQGFIDEITALRRHNEGVRQLIELERPQGQLDRAQLFLRQRRLAVLRRKFHDMQLQEKKLHQEMEELGQQMREMQARRQHWHRQQEKYQRWADRQRQQRRVVRLRQEENEMQEIITWKS